MTEFLKLQKIAVQYIPERLVLRDAMPATPSEKIQKFGCARCCGKATCNDLPRGFRLKSTTPRPDCA